ncbi:MAG: hypothetical protein LC725_09215, partial [Lentisphaerae bacterium]|nr:hypothetical protein [Lentisphaerota bacterium]
MIKPDTGINPVRRDFRKIAKAAGLVLVAVVVVAAAAAGWIAHQKQQARLAAEQVAQQRREAALEQGERAWNRINMLVEHISRDVDTVTPMEQQVFEWAADIGDRSKAPTQAIMEIDQYNEYFNEAEDLYAMSWLIRQHLHEDAPLELAEETAVRLESTADRLAVIYQEIDGIFEAVQKLVKDTENAYKRVLTSRTDAQRRAAEAAVRRREEAEARQRAEEEARLAEERRPLVLQQEYDLVDRSRGANVPLMAQWRFKDAMAAMREVQTQLTQPETQEYCANVLEAYARIEQLRQFLIKTIAATPYPGGWST